MARKIGTREDRINRFFRMCLEWQYDIRNNIEKNASHYFRKYRVGNYAVKYFVDLGYATIDRQYIINKMKYIQDEYNKMRENHKA